MTTPLLASGLGVRTQGHPPAGALGHSTDVGVQHRLVEDQRRCGQAETGVRLANHGLRQLVCPDEPASGCDGRQVLESRNRDDVRKPADRAVLSPLAFVRSRLDESHTLDSLARLCGPSTRTLARRTRNAMGLSPLQLVQRVRLERSLHQLHAPRGDRRRGGVGRSGDSAPTGEETHRAITRGAAPECPGAGLLICGIVTAVTSMRYSGWAQWRNDYVVAPP